MEEQQARFIKEALAAHNHYRKKHGAAPLKHNPELSKKALKYAKYLSAVGDLMHSHDTFKNQPMGENLAYMFDSEVDDYSGKLATYHWYREIEEHNFDLPEIQSRTGHFTQLVWKGSREVGFGLARDNYGKFFAVAHYFPAGNYAGEFKKNVSRPLY
jgi:uncharacterized protein YkwD